jgi:hypothetical protein
MKQVIRAVALVCISLGGLYLFRFSKSEEKVLYPASCHCIVDPVFSELVHQKIKSFVDQSYDQKREMQDFLDSVQEQFPVIDSASVSLDNAQTMSLLVSGQKPYVRINKDFVSTESGTVFSQGSFSNQSLQGLKSFSCSSGVVSDFLEQRALLFFKRIPDPFFDMYKVHWASNEEIWFHHKEKDYSVLVSSGWDMNVEDVYACHTIQDELVENQREKNKRRRKKVHAKWVCDLRFKGQVIAYPIFS